MIKLKSLITETFDLSVGKTIDLGDGFYLKNCGDGRFKAYENSTNEMAMTLHVYAHEGIPSVSNVEVMDKFRGKGLYRRSLPIIKKVFGNVRSSRYGETSPEAEKAWKSLNATDLSIGKKPYGNNSEHGLSKYMLDEEDYKGEHEAPDKTSGPPMYDLNGMYPNDIYSSDAARMYGDNHGDLNDIQSLHIIQAAKGRPKYQVKIYRAVPDLNFELKQKLAPLYHIIFYHNKFNFFPIKNEIVNNLTSKYSIEKYSYDEQQKNILADVSAQIEALISQAKQKIKINTGDWVTINRTYAKEHGESNLNNKFIIVSKTVPAKFLYTDGNSLHEWGFDAS